MASSPWRISSDVLIGRDGEAARLRSFPSDMDDGRPSVALISGEGGIGKTRLIADALEPWREAGATVLVGTSPDLSAAPPYSALLDALRGAPTADAEDAIDALTGAVDLPRTQLFEAVRSAVVGLARRSAVILVIEDLHWADRATLDLLRYCLATGREGSWGLVASYRDDEARDRPDVLDFLADVARGTVARLPLAPLSREQVAQQIASISGSVAA
ncbi:MAG TPA: ATP-binding protein, partial [Longimicrobiaceae bacterium]|nr:ATP-binding protein [Longimicrobiaceae bacterium]